VGEVAVAERLWRERGRTATARPSGRATDEVWKGGSDRAAVAVNEPANRGLGVDAAVRERIDATRDR